MGRHKTNKVPEYNKEEAKINNLYLLKLCEIFENKAGDRIRYLKYGMISNIIMKLQWRNIETFSAKRLNKTAKYND